MSARLATAAALLLAFGGALALAAHGWGWAWTALLIATLAAGMYEWARLLGLGRAWRAAYAAPLPLGMALLFGNALLFPPAIRDPFSGIIPLSLFFLAFFWVAWLLVLPFGALLLSRSPGCRRAARVVWGLGGLWIMPAAAAPMIFMGMTGWSLVLFLLLAAAATDAAAFLAGRRFGRRLLLPRLSPAKTWLGLWAGLAAAAAVGALLPPLLSLAGAAPYVDWARVGPAYGLLFGLAVGVCVVAGDLAVSALKRSAGVKDSGRLLPGHGGALDRIDGFLLAAPAFLAVFSGWPITFWE